MSMDRTSIDMTGERMRSRTRTVGVLLAAVLLAPIGLAGAPGTAQAKPAKILGTPAKAAADAVTVTLITGDKVTLRGSDRAVVEAGPGRRDMKFATSRAGGHLRVVPADVVPLLR